MQDYRKSLEDMHHIVISTLTLTCKLTRLTHCNFIIFFKFKPHSTGICGCQATTSTTAQRYRYHSIHVS